MVVKPPRQWFNHKFMEPAFCSASIWHAASNFTFSSPRLVGLRTVIFFPRQQCQFHMLIHLVNITKVIFLSLACTLCSQWAPWPSLHVHFAATVELFLVKEANISSLCKFCTHVSRDYVNSGTWIRWSIISYVSSIKLRSWWVLVILFCMCCILIMFDKISEILYDYKCEIYSTGFIGSALVWDDGGTNKWDAASRFLKASSVLTQETTAE